MSYNITEAYKLDSNNGTQLDSIVQNIARVGNALRVSCTLQVRSGQIAIPLPSATPYTDVDDEQIFAVNLAVMNTSINTPFTGKLTNVKLSGSLDTGDKIAEITGRGILGERDAVLILRDYISKDVTALRAGTVFQITFDIVHADPGSKNPLPAKMYISIVNSVALRGAADDANIVTYSDTMTKNDLSYKHVVLDFADIDEFVGMVQSSASRLILMSLRINLTADEEEELASSPVNIPANLTVLGNVILYYTSSNTYEAIFRSVKSRDTSATITINAFNADSQTSLPTSIAANQTYALMFTIANIPTGYKVQIALSSLADNGTFTMQGESITTGSINADGIYIYKFTTPATLSSNYLDIEIVETSNTSNILKSNRFTVYSNSGGAPTGVTVTETVQYSTKLDGSNTTYPSGGDTCTTTVALSGISTMATVRAEYTSAIWNPDTSFISQNGNSFKFLCILPPLYDSVFINCTFLGNEGYWKSTFPVVSVNFLQNGYIRNGSTIAESNTEIDGVKLRSGYHYKITVGALPDLVVSHAPDDLSLSYDLAMLPFNNSPVHIIRAVAISGQTDTWAFYSSVNSDLAIRNSSDSAHLKLDTYADNNSFWWKVKVVGVMYYGYYEVKHLETGLVWDVDHSNYSSNNPLNIYGLDYNNLVNRRFKFEEVNDPNLLYDNNGLYTASGNLQNAQISWSYDEGATFTGKDTVKMYYNDTQMTTVTNTWTVPTSMSTPVTAVAKFTANSISHQEYAVLTDSTSPSGYAITTFKDEQRTLNNAAGANADVNFSINVKFYGSNGAPATQDDAYIDLTYRISIITPVSSSIISFQIGTVNKLSSLIKVFEDDEKIMLVYEDTVGTSPGNVTYIISNNDEIKTGSIIENSGIALSGSVTATATAAQEMTLLIHNFSGKHITKTTDASITLNGTAANGTNYCYAHYFATNSSSQTLHYVNGTLGTSLSTTASVKYAWPNIHLELTSTHPVINAAFTLYQDTVVAGNDIGVYNTVFSSGVHTTSPFMLLKEKKIIATCIYTYVSDINGTETPTTTSAITVLEKMSALLTKINLAVYSSTGSPITNYFGTNINGDDRMYKYTFTLPTGSSITAFKIKPPQDTAWSDVANASGVFTLRSTSNTEIPMMFAISTTTGGVKTYAYANSYVYTNSTGALKPKVTKNSGSGNTSNYSVSLYCPYYTVPVVGKIFKIDSNSTAVATVTNNHPGDTAVGDAKYTGSMSVDNVVPEQTLKYNYIVNLDKFFYNMYVEDYLQIGTVGLSATAKFYNPDRSATTQDVKYTELRYQITIVVPGGETISNLSFGSDNVASNAVKVLSDDTKNIYVYDAIVGVITSNVTCTITTSGGDSTSVDFVQFGGMTAETNGNEYTISTVPNHARDLTLVIGNSDIFADDGAFDLVKTISSATSVTCTRYSINSNNHIYAHYIVSAGAGTSETLYCASAIDVKGSASDSLSCAFPSGGWKYGVSVPVYFASNKFITNIAFILIDDSNPANVIITLPAPTWNSNARFETSLVIPDTVPIKNFSAKVEYTYVSDLTGATMSDDATLQMFTDPMNLISKIDNLNVKIDDDSDTHAEADTTGNLVSSYAVNLYSGYTLSKVAFNTSSYNGATFNATNNTTEFSVWYNLPNAKKDLPAKIYFEHTYSSATRYSVIDTYVHKIREDGIYTSVSESNGTYTVTLDTDYLLTYCFRYWKDGDNMPTQIFFSNTDEEKNVSKNVSSTDLSDASATYQYEYLFRRTDINQALSEGFYFVRYGGILKQASGAAPITPSATVKFYPQSTDPKYTDLHYQLTVIVPSGSTLSTAMIANVSVSLNVAHSDTSKKIYTYDGVVGNVTSNVSYSITVTGTPSTTLTGNFIVGDSTITLNNNNNTLEAISSGNDITIRIYQIGGVTNAVNGSGSASISIGTSKTYAYAYYIDSAGVLHYAKGTYNGNTGSTALSVIAATDWVGPSSDIKLKLDTNEILSDVVINIVDASNHTVKTLTTLWDVSNNYYITYNFTLSGAVSTAVASYNVVDDIDGNTTAGMTSLKLFSPLIDVITGVSFTVTDNDNPPLTVNDYFGQYRVNDNLNFNYTLSLNTGISISKIYCNKNSTPASTNSNSFTQSISKTGDVDVPLTIAIKYSSTSDTSFPYAYAYVSTYLYRARDGSISTSRDTGKISLNVPYNCHVSGKIWDIDASETPIATINQSYTSGSSAELAHTVSDTKTYKYRYEILRDELIHKFYKVYVEDYYHVAQGTIVSSGDPNNIVLTVTTRIDGSDVKYTPSFIDGGVTMTLLHGYLELHDGTQSDFSNVINTEKIVPTYTDTTNVYYKLLYRPVGSSNSTTLSAPILKFKKDSVSNFNVTSADHYVVRTFAFSGTTVNALNTTGYDIIYASGVISLTLESDVRDIDSDKDYLFTFNEGAVSNNSPNITYTLQNKYEGTFLRYNYAGNTRPILDDKTITFDTHESSSNVLFLLYLNSDRSQLHNATLTGSGSAHTYTHGSTLSNQGSLTSIFMFIGSDNILYFNKHVIGYDDMEEYDDGQEGTPNAITITYTVDGTNVSQPSEINETLMTIKTHESVVATKVKYAIWKRDSNGTRKYLTKSVSLVSNDFYEATFSLSPVVPENDLWLETTYYSSGNTSIIKNVKLDMVVGTKSAQVGGSFNSNDF